MAFDNILGITQFQYSKVEFQDSFQPTFYSDKQDRK